MHRATNPNRWYCYRLAEMLVKEHKDTIEGRRVL